MEVDDAIVMAETPTPATNATVNDDKTVLGAVDSGEQEQNTPTSSIIKQKRAKLKHDKEEPPGTDAAHNETATPFKLEVSGSEDEGGEEEEENDGATRAAIRRKLLSTPLEEDATANDGLDEYETVALKRKRYEVRRSGSEDCLLGFDELSGEAELVKPEDVQDNKMEKEEAPSVVADAQVVTTDPPKSVKKTPPQKTAQSPSQNASRSSSKSPMSQKAKSPALQSPSNKVAQKTPPKPHIVADGEEINGGQDVDMKPVVQTPNSTAVTKKPLSPQDEFYKKPFDFGWKRELVWRANIETSKDKADVYFISPAGKKLRARNEIIPLLEGDLTIDHFSFAKEPLGAGPEFEIVRSAKPSSRSSVATATLAAAPSPPIVGKRVSKPKGPKGASPPPQGWTPSKALKVNNAALLSSSGNPGRHSMGSQHHAQQNMTSTPVSKRHDNASSTGHNASHSSKSSKLKKQVNDIENDLKQINESILKNRKQSNNSADGYNSHNSQVVAAAPVDHSSKIFATNFFANVSYAYDSLLCIMKYLKIHERPRAAAVCKLWNLAAKDTSLWKTVRMKNSKVCSWSGFAAALRRGETKHLDLRKMLQPSGRSEDLWNDFCENIGTVCSLESIYLCRCSSRVVESLFQSNRNLRIINALAINDDTINLENISRLNSLEELRLRTCESGVLAGDLAPLATLDKLTHLSLTSIKGLGEKSVEVLGELKTLRSLELGECGDFDSTFAEAVLPKLINLQRLRLENGSVTNVCTLEILDSVARLVQLHQLELVNFDIKPGFDEKLSLCTNITKLLIIPTYISQSATTNQIVLSAVQQVADTLKVFTWCVTVELLRVTALYVDQCEESTKKEKHHFDECIPVLKPVPGAPPNDEDEEELKAHNADTSGEDGNGDVPQIEILPLDKVETILAENLPHTKFTIVKVPYHVTCKQQLVD
ncbi:uncharacterized protein LOC101898876 isoform X2 [Musca domestica]|uniref:Uncharacterized protein LOC101898876 isoform X2 n=1 Tax=Musca domestica TaxID=7370 RepID=A0A9J7I0U1_MUSDO|nr:uncharacterized protein LOC101898876 isoform X2 [Musca domestica]